MELIYTEKEINKQTLNEKIQVAMKLLSKIIELLILQHSLLQQLIRVASNKVFVERQKKMILLQQIQAWIGNVFRKCAHQRRTFEMHNQANTQ